MDSENRQDEIVRLCNKMINYESKVNIVPLCSNSINLEWNYGVETELLNNLCIIFGNDISKPPVLLNDNIKRGPASIEVKT